MIHNILCISALLCLIINNATAMDQVQISAVDLALINATKLGSIKEVNNQLQQGANINPKGTTTTALIEACKLLNNNDLVAVLLENKADTNIPDAQGRMPLHFAADANNITILKKLRKAGAAIDHQDNEGNSPCHFATQKQHLNTLEWLIEEGANMNLHNKKGLTPLHEAALYSKFCSYVRLPRIGADFTLVTTAGEMPNAPLPAGSTVFHACTQATSAEQLMQKWLLSYLLFPDNLIPKALRTFLCTLKQCAPALYRIRKNVLLPYLAPIIAVQPVVNLLKSENKDLSLVARKILHQRATKVHAVLLAQDVHGQTALMREMQKNPNNTPSPNTLLDANSYNTHLLPFIAALRTNTLSSLPDSNVFKITYEYALPRKEELTVAPKQEASSPSSCVIC